MLTEGDRRRAESLPAVVLLVALSAIAPLSIDMFLPSLPTMTEEFGATRSTMQLAVLLFILAFAGSQLVYGPTSDRVGRRPVLFVGLSLFVAGGLSSAAPGDQPGGASCRPRTHERARRLPRRALQSHVRLVRAGDGADVQ